MFPAKPISSQVEVGAELAAKKPGFKPENLLHEPDLRLNIQIVYGDDQKTIGTWSNGWSKRPVEWALRVSPELVSRWLGFRERRELWPEGELERRWKLASDIVADEAVFIVQLSAFPKLPTAGTIGDEERAELEDFVRNRFVVRADGKQIDSRVYMIDHWQAREKSDLDDYPWWQRTDFAHILGSEWETRPYKPLPLGDYHRAWYWVSARMPEEPVGKLELFVLSPNKERKAEFRLDTLSGL